MLCLTELLEGEGDIYDESSDWINMVDRGGLTHVSNTTFLLLSAVEAQVKDYLSQHSGVNAAEIRIDEVKEKVLMSDEVEVIGKDCLATGRKMRAVQFYQCS